MFNLKRLLYRLTHGTAPSPVERETKPIATKPEKVLRYVYLNLCAGDRVTLDVAYELYEEENLVRVVEYGEEKVYIEVMLDPDQKYFGNYEAFDRI